MFNKRGVELAFLWNASWFFRDILALYQLLLTYKSETPVRGGAIQSDAFDDKTQLTRSAEFSSKDAKISLSSFFTALQW